MDRFFDLNPPSQEASRPKPRRLALLIGNSAYSGSSLKNPVNDTALLAGVLRGLGFGTTVVENAGADKLRDAIVAAGSALRQAKPETIFFFYYSGHGLQHRGQNYLVPVGARMQDGEGVIRECVALDFLLAELSKGRQDASIVVLDACRKSFTQEQPIANWPEGLAPILQVPNGTLIAFSTAAGAVAKDGTGPNSPYAELLAEGLNRGNKSLSEIFHNVAEAMSRRTGGEQTPFLAAQVFPEVVLDGNRKSWTVTDLVRRPSAPLVGSAAGLMLAVLATPLAPPWPAQMAGLTAVFEVLAILTALHLLTSPRYSEDRSASTAEEVSERPRLLGVSIVLLALITGLYLVLVSLYTYEV